MTASADPDAARLRLAAAAERLAMATGDARFNHAAGVLRGKRAGRPVIDDSAALAYARSLIDAGLARSARHAAGMAAQLYSASNNEADRISERIRKKMGKK